MQLIKIYFEKEYWPAVYSFEEKFISYEQIKNICYYWVVCFRLIELFHTFCLISSSDTQKVKGISK